MTTTADPDEAPPKKSKLPLLLGLVLAILGGAGGYFAVAMGLLTFGGAAATDDDYGGGDAASDYAADGSDTQASLAFVALDPLLISIPSDTGRSFLRFAAQLEVRPEYMAEVENLKPRIVDVLNGYLRAVDIAELEDPTALVRLRAQMLRRLQIVAGEGRIRDLLIMEFVLN
ncbi:flagellar basal body-associated FliL family protein [Yoonia sp. 208BN28-4]|uniref:flagellar basal body-associated FliL family protein n=1 Tax=Yoonia sp. 208BN28-4 TaxID=3126505 RepID=UPI0030B55AC6